VKMSVKSFLGLEISTQQVKVVVIDAKLNVVYQDGVKFDTDLPEFKTSGGVHVHGDHVTVTAPPLMWTKAVDLALERMMETKFDFSSILAVSGTGQQHGSVYWRNGARQTLTSLDKSQTLAEQLDGCFSVDASPIWMDSSTGSQCRRLEQHIGGALKLA
jgi:xylulokinase